MLNKVIEDIFRVHSKYELLGEILSCGIECLEPYPTQKSERGPERGSLENLRR